MCPVVPGAAYLLVELAQAPRPRQVTSALGVPSLTRGTRSKTRPICSQSSDMNTNDIREHELVSRIGYPPGLERVTRFTNTFRKFEGF